jgi:acylphosphatase
MIGSPADRRCLHVIVSGRVQGVGYRAWVERQAAARGLDGWVRNRRDGTVEAVFAGGEDDLNSMIAACRDGPSAARVVEVAVTDTAGPPSPGFSVLPTA